MTIYCCAGPMTDGHCDACGRDASPRELAGDPPCPTCGGLGLDPKGKMPRSTSGGKDEDPPCSTCGGWGVVAPEHPARYGTRETPQHLVAAHKDDSVKPVLHRVLYSIAYGPRSTVMEKVEYFEPEDERFLRRLVRGLEENPRATVHSITTTTVDWTDGTPIMDGFDGIG